MINQIRRREYRDLLQRMGESPDNVNVHAYVHIGSPVFSNLFLEEAGKIFNGPQYDGKAVDVDGYLFEALTQNYTTWEEEISRDPDLMLKFLIEFPTFYEDVQRLKANIEARRGHPLMIKVIDYGTDPYWGDIGQAEQHD